MQYVGLDIETNDLHLLDKGASWVYGEGEILCTSLYYEKTGKKKVIKKWNEEVRSLLLNENVTIVGANIIYDIGWLEYEMGIQGKTKANLLDVISAEALIDEYGMSNLEYLGQKYLRRGKVKSALEDWAAGEGLHGDFRKHLKDAPWNLLKEYAADDAELPVLIMRKQEPILQAQGIDKPFDIDCRLIPYVLQMKQRGSRIDMKKKAENCAILEDRLKEKKATFTKKYGAVNLNSSKQVAALLDRQDIPYRYKFTVKGRGPVKYGWSELRQGKIELDEVVRGFRRDKGKLVAKIDKSHKDRMCDILDAAGFDYICNPNVDKKFLDAVADEYPVTKLIKEIKQIDGIISKFLGPGFDRFVIMEEDGLGRVFGDFNISKSDEFGTISGRFSGSNPNLQQIPSKGVIDEGTDRELNLAKMCREIFVAERDCWKFKIDYSQIEYRLLVHYARGPGSKEARARFNEDPKTDYHQFVMDVTGLERKPAKNCNFGIMYGMGASGMQDAFGWTAAKVEEVLSVYHEALPYVATTMTAVSDQAKEKGFITTIGSRRARIRNKDMAYAMLNRLNQGGSADMMKTAMVMAGDEGLLDSLHVELTVHDELVGSVPKTKEGVENLKRLQEIMENCIKLRVPVIAEPEVGPNWYDVEDLDEAVAKEIA